MVIVIQCEDRVGLVAAISGILAERNVNILSMREFVDTADNRFFARLEVDNNEHPEHLKAALLQKLPQGALVQIYPSPGKKIIIMVTKEYHCLADILIRNHFHALNASVQCVIGNHDLLNDICHRFDVPFYNISHAGKTIAEFEENILTVIDKYQPEYLVLAKFMRILSPSFIQRFPMKIINIHHSFLPAFSGASPYKQAFQRGVKLIGATSHFVTNELDEGPIIAQQIIPVSHSYTVKDMVKAGKEIETAVLAKALQLVMEERVVVYENKTIVFE